MKAKLSESINLDKNFGDSIKLASRLFWEGKIFIYPTDTIYSFGANPFNEQVLKHITHIKGYEFGRLHILLVKDIPSLLNHVEIFSEGHLDFLSSLWPNPISVVFKLKENIQKILGMEKAAFRIPNHRFCLKLLEEIKLPLLSTSVNRDNEKPILEPSKIISEFGNEVDAIFYSSKKSYFNAATLVDLSGDKPLLLRNGKIKLDSLLEKFH